MNRLGILRLLFLLALVPAWGLFFPGTAHAATCSVTGNTVSFGTFDPQTGNQDTQTTLDYTCTQTGFLIVPSVSLNVCLSIGMGNGGQINPRLASDGVGHSLAFQLYTDADRAANHIWGVVNTSYAPPTLPITIPAAFGFQSSASGHATIYGRVPSGQSGIAAGTYNNPITDAYISFREAPQSCGTTNQGAFAVPVQAIVAKACTVTASDLGFGATGLLSAITNGTSTITVNCVSGTQYKIGLDNGQHALGSTRNMQGSGGQKINYELYRDAARTLRWGNTPPTDTVNANGTGNNQNSTVYGRVPPQTTPSPGDYSDTVTVNITY